MPSYFTEMSNVKSRHCFTPISHDSQQSRSERARIILQQTKTQCHGLSSIQVRRELRKHFKYVVKPIGQYYIIFL
jgi:hypothetical protein